jgi:hypothetical protein
MKDLGQLLAKFSFYTLHKLIINELNSLEVIIIEGLSVHLNMKTITVNITTIIYMFVSSIERNYEQTIKFLQTFLIHYFYWKSRLTA